MRLGSIVCAKSVEHRDVVKMRENKSGKQAPITNRFGFKFQPEMSLLSHIGVFIFLGTFPEQTDADVTFKFAEKQLNRLGWISTDTGLLDAARNALIRLDREDAEKRAAGTPPAHDGVAGSVNDQLRAAIRLAEREGAR